MNNLIIRHAHICTPQGREALKGEDMSHLTEIYDGFIVIEDGIITYVGEDSDMPTLPSDKFYEEIDAQGNAVLPGFVDSHTHLIFGGYRPDEFEWRMKGDTYMSIMERGGGIQSTVNATREATVRELQTKAQWFINRMLHDGVTTVEAKSGYGLSLESELKMLDAIQALAEDPEQKIRIVSTF
ncbi:MAG: amidohydrolase family protein, partial [Muribaculaceae bacterium]|nr:amidohydrolase family protein [Muribaculaceae bacterium]